MKRTLKKIGLLTLGLLSLNSWAQLNVQIGELGYGGNGCPAGSVSGYAAETPEGASLSLLFDSFIVEAGPSSGKTIDRKSCNLAIPITVPAGYSISIFAVDYLGFVHLPNEIASAKFRSEFFFTGSQGPIRELNFSGPVTTLFNTRDLLEVENQTSSGCGQDTIFRVNTSMLLRNNSFEDAIALVDHVDLNAGLVFQIQFHKCGDENLPLPEGDYIKESSLKI